MRPGWGAGLGPAGADGIALEVCPTSNLRTGAVEVLPAHPLPRLLAAGVPVTLATDDPGMFHTDLNAEHQLCHDVFGLGPADLAEIARTGVRAAFCSPALRERMLAEIDAVVAAQAPGPRRTGFPLGRPTRTGHGPMRGGRR